MSDHPEIPSRDAVIRRCRELGKSSNGFAFNDYIWVKYGHYVTMSEADMQQYVYEHADPSIVRIPKVLDAFESSFTAKYSMTCIVMERVTVEDCDTYIKRLWTTEEDPPWAEAKRLAEKAAKAIRHLWTIPIPENAKPGPFRGRRPVDRFFSDAGSDQAFDSLEELEQWVDRKLQKVRPGAKISFSEEPMIICHGDLSPWNIFISEPMTIIDWGFSGIYPKCFDEFGICHQFTLDSQFFARILHEELFGPGISQEMYLFSRVATYILWGR